jgi:hypothetical protein
VGASKITFHIEKFNIFTGIMFIDEAKIKKLRVFARSF